MSESEDSKRMLDSSGDLSEEDGDNCSSTTTTNGNNSSPDSKKTCVDCGTSKTPLWRGGPAGPKSLCNACGIKSRKKRQAALGIRPEEKKKNRKSNNSNNSVSLDHRNLKSSNSNSSHDDLRSCNNKNENSKGVGRFLDLGFKVPVMKRSAMEKKRLWRKLGEEERAAVLLMALSYGSVYA